MLLDKLPVLETKGAQWRTLWNATSKEFGRGLYLETEQGPNLSSLVLTAKGSAQMNFDPFLCRGGC